MRPSVLFLLAYLAFPDSAAAQDDMSGASPPSELAIGGFQYGGDQANRVRVTDYRPSRNLPVIVFVPAHPASGRVSRIRPDWIPDLAVSRHMVVAWIEPHAHVDRRETDFLASVADGVAALAQKSHRYGFSNERIVLIGVGEGAHTAALLATDAHLLPARGVPLEWVKGMLSLDGSGFDVLQWRSRLDPRRDGALLKVLPDDPALSPRAQADAPNAAAFLFVTVKDDRAATDETLSFANRLTQAGSRVSVLPVVRTSERLPKSFPGSESNPQRDALAAFMLGGLAAPH